MHELLIHFDSSCYPNRKHGWLLQNKKRRHGQLSCAVSFFFSFCFFIFFPPLPASGGHSRPLALGGGMSVRWGAFQVEYGGEPNDSLMVDEFSVNLGRVCKSQSAKSASVQTEDRVNESSIVIIGSDVVFVCIHRLSLLLLDDRLNWFLFFSFFLFWPLVQLHCSSEVPNFPKFALVFHRLSWLGRTKKRINGDLSRLEAVPENCPRSGWQCGLLPLLCFLFLH